MSDFGMPFPFICFSRRSTAGQCWPPSADQVLLVAPFFAIFACLPCCEGFGLAQLGQMSPVVREQVLLTKIGPLPAPDH